jgi:hypothetical protein
MDQTQRWYREANAMSKRDGLQKSECPRSTALSANRTRREPAKGKGGTWSLTVGGKHDRGTEP